MARSASRRKAIAPDDLETFLHRQMRDAMTQPKRTKRTAVRLALTAAIREAMLGPGDRLPPETELADMLGVSLGTVQAALRQLQQVGVITRRRGDGSKVAIKAADDSPIWHFRFARRHDGAPVRLINQTVLRVDITTDRGTWTEVLGARPAYIRIRRRYDEPDCQPIGAEMFLDPALAPGLSQLTASDLEMINIREHLFEQFGIETIGAEHRVQTATADAATAATFGITPGEEIFEIHAEAFSHDHRPTYFQRIHVPTADFVLLFRNLIAR